MRSITFRISVLFGMLSLIQAAACQEQTSNQIAVVEFIKVKAGGMEDARYYYEQNWKVLREMAMDSSYISSYAMMITESDTTAYSFILQTIYPDSVAYSMSETRFGELIRILGGDGPQLLSDKRPQDFRESLGSGIFEVLHTRSSFQ